MLFYRSRWQFAFERNPHREARLLWQNVPPQTPDPNATPQTPDANNPLQPIVIHGGAGVNPDGTPVVPNATNTTQTPDTAQPVETVEQNVQTTRTATANTLQQPEQLRMPAIAQAFITMRTQLEKVRELRFRPDVKEVIKKLDPAEQADISQAMDLLDTRWEMLGALEAQAVKFNRWKAGDLTPREMRAALEDFLDIDRDPQQEAVLRAFDASVADPEVSDAMNQWNRGGLAQESDKIDLAQRVWEEIDGGDLEMRMNVYVNEWQKDFKNMETIFVELAKPQDEYEKKLKEEKEAMGNTASLGLLQQFAEWRRNGIMGVGLYTPNEVILAFKKVWTAFQNAHDEFTDQQANKLAAAMGGTLDALKLPYGAAINRRLGSTLESEFGKQKNEYKDELGDDDFATLVSKFQQVRSDPAKAIAVLEVAAGHGWLYDIADLGDAHRNPKIFGVDYLSITPPHWDPNQQDNYLGTLTRSNNSGQSEERSKGAARVKEQVKPEVFKDRFEKALAGHNYWSAMGIAETFINRGKTAEVSEYLTLSFLEHLRTDADARRYMTRPVLEQFGIMNDKWGTANFATTNIVFNIDSVYALKANPNAMNGPFLSTVERLQNDILAASGGRMSRKEVIEKASQMLAGKIIEVNGQSLSLFSERYREYWDETKNPIFGTFEGKQALNTAPDYYQMDGSVLLLPKKSMIAIFKTGSTGTLDAPEFAQNVVGQTILRMEQLRKNNLPAAKIFRAEMGRKLKEAIALGFTGQAPKHLHKYNWLRGGEEGKPMLADLIRHGFMTRGEVVQFAQGHQGADEFTRILDEQLRAIPPMAFPEDNSAQPVQEQPRRPSRRAPRNTPNTAA